MAGRMNDYVLRLAHDPQALAAFQKDPGTAMSAAGLSREERVVLGSKDPVAIRNSFVSDLGADAADATWVVVIIDVRAVALEQ
jgi:hypothetical protein